MQPTVRLLVLSVVALALAACGGPSTPTPRVNGVDVTLAAATLAVGQTTTATAEVDAQAGTSTNVIWTSTDPSVATVTQAGVVTAVAEGTTGITATSTVDTSRNATATLTVTEAEPTGYTVNGYISDMTYFPLPNTLSIVALHSSAFAPLSTEYDGQFLVVANSIVDQEGNFELNFSESIPAKYLSTAANAINLPPYVDPADSYCTLSGTTTNRVLRSWMISSGIMVPFGIAGAVSQNLMAADGIVLYTTLEDLMGPPVGEFSIGTWMYAEGPNTITGGCFEDDGIEVTQFATINLELEQGWNPLQVTMDAGEGTISIQVNEFEGNWVFAPGGL